MRVSQAETAIEYLPRIEELDTQGDRHRIGGVQAPFPAELPTGIGLPEGDICSQS